MAKKQEEKTKINNVIVHCKYDELIELGKLKPHPANPNTHPDKQIELLGKIMQKHGIRWPICVSNLSGYIISGHGRLMAANNLKLDKYPVVYQDFESESEELAVLVNDNKISELAETDGLKLADIIVELDQVDYPLELTALSETEISDYVIGPTNFPTEKEDDAPELPNEATTKIGDLYILGEHRLLCGDSTKQEDVERLMDGQKAVLMNTDPPYGIDFVSLSKSKGQSKKYNDIENDELINGDELQEFLESAIKVALPFLGKNTAFYLWHPMLTQGTFFAAAAADILIHRQIIWVKPSMVFGRGDYHWRHELCFYGWIKGNRPNFYGERNQTTIWEVGRENDKIHPTQKPVELFIRPINNHTKIGDICYEPFSGSGSQFIACEKLRRKCYGMEIDPKYCDVIVKRWEDFTGEKAILNAKNT